MPPTPAFAAAGRSAPGARVRRRLRVGLLAAGGPAAATTGDDHRGPARAASAATRTPSTSSTNEPANAPGDPNPGGPDDPAVPPAAPGAPDGVAGVAPHATLVSSSAVVASVRVRQPTPRGEPQGAAGGGDDSFARTGDRACGEHGCRGHRPWRHGLPAGGRSYGPAPWLGAGVWYTAARQRRRRRLLPAPATRARTTARRTRCSIR